MIENPKTCVLCNGSPRLKRDPNDWELEETITFLEVVSNLNPILDTGDGWN